jgi:hypothetical protein
MDNKIEKLLNAKNHKEKNWHTWIQHKKILGHVQMTKPKNSWGRRRS